MAVFIYSSCAVKGPGASHAPGPLVVCKTRQDYRKLLSVQLSEDGRSLVAFPAPSDVENQRPVELADGYLLQRMPGNAFLSLSIEEYALGSHAYSEEEILEMVIDRRPYLEIYECSECCDEDTASINRLIRQGRLKECKSLQ